MQLKSIVLTLVASTTDLILAAPNPQTATISSASISASSTTSTATSSDACAQLAQATAGARSNTIVVSAEAAWNCLQAVPFDSTTAEAWIDSLRPYVRWQTTLSYLKNPPTTYVSPAFDFYGSLDQITANVRNGTYRNQYEFEYAIFSSFISVHDNHFYYLPNLVGGIVSFIRPFALVSISSDGQELPKQYVYSDVLLSYNDSNFKPSAITTINGENVTTHLEKFSAGSDLTDPDARWNNLFLQLSSVQKGASGQGSGTYAGGGLGGSYYTNATTSLVFENGTMTMYNNTARLLVNLTGVISAQDLYTRYVKSPTLTLPSSTSCANLTAPGFPQPVNRTACNTIGGYFINNTGYGDVAVLSLTTFPFLQFDDDSVNLTLKFLDQAKAAGKTKLIIDLSSNSGGDQRFGFTLFEKLFPSMHPYLGTRWRATEVFDIIGQTISNYSNGTSDAPPSNGTDFFSYFNGLFFGGQTPFPYRSDLDANGQSFPNWQAKYAPHAYNDDNFTSIMQYNFSQPHVNIINSYLAPVASNGALFEPQNVILLTDGYCSSTCSAFVEYMTVQAGVKTVTVGGRPNKEMMQVVGGTRGAEIYSFNLIKSTVTLTYNLTQRIKTPQDAANLYTNTQIGEYIGANGTDPNLALRRAGTYSCSVNNRDVIPRNDTNQIPLQFQYQAADCRIYWTADMTVDITSLWKEVYDVTWGDGQCVAGSIKNSTSSWKKRSSKERMERRWQQRRYVSPAELETLANSVNVFTNHRYIPSDRSMVVP